MKLVILDSYALQEGDLQWEEAYKLVDEVDCYARTAYEDAFVRLNDADLAICNKCPIDATLLNQLPNLKWIGETATGTDNLDLAACRTHGIDVANVPGYSTYSVTQLTFSLLLNICQSPSAHEAAMRAGYWQKNVPQSFGVMPQKELLGKTFGIIGYGDIGKQSACVAKALGMNVICHTRTLKQDLNVKFVSLDELLQQSDVITLHCPLTPQTKEIINKQTLSKMKTGAILLNTARGALINEQDVADALGSGKLAAYGADVFTKEPIIADNPVLSAPNTFLTPHIAWATKEALTKLSDEVCKNLSAYLCGKKRNIVNK